MLFSILIPVYNAELYIGDCLDSILCQSGDDYEIIIINDGSTDKSGEICETYAKRHKDKVSVFNRVNKGVFLTRKELISLAHGKYILFVDSDDYLQSEALNILRKKIELTSIDIIIFEYATYLNSEVRHCNLRKKLKDKLVYSENKNDIYDVLVQSDSLNSMCTKLFSKELLDKCKSKDFDVRVEIGEDFLQVIPLISTARTIMYINDELYFYRIHDNNTHLKFKFSRFNDSKIIWQLLNEYLTTTWGASKDQICFANQKIMKMVVSSIMQIAVLECKMPPFHQQKKYLQSISNDSFFTKIYTSSNIDLFRKAEKIPIKLLYNGMPLIALIYLRTYKVYVRIICNYKKLGNFFKLLKSVNT